MKLIEKDLEMDSTEGLIDSIKNEYFHKELSNENTPKEKFVHITNNEKKEIKKKREIKKKVEENKENLNNNSKINNDMDVIKVISQRYTNNQTSNTQQTKNQTMDVLPNNTKKRNQKKNKNSSKLNRNNNFSFNNQDNRFYFKNTSNSQNSRFFNLFTGKKNNINFYIEETLRHKALTPQNNNFKFDENPERSIYSIAASPTKKY
jgi:hypothetical protein